MRGRSTAAKALNNTYPRTVVVVEAATSPVKGRPARIYIDILVGEYIDEDSHTRTPPQHVRIDANQDLRGILDDLIAEAEGYLE